MKNKGAKTLENTGDAVFKKSPFPAKWHFINNLLELQNISDEESAEKILFDEFPLNIKVKPEDVEILLPPIELTKEIIGGRNPERWNRYTRPVFLDEMPRKEIKKPTPAKSDPQIDLPEDAYLRYTSAQLRVIERNHSRISNRFKEWLQRNGASNIVVEKDAIDIRCAYAGKMYLFELKTCYRLSTRHALREALGQVLEYSYYPNRQSPDMLTIVIDTPPSSADIEWFKNIAVKLEVELFWLKGESVYCGQITSCGLAAKCIF